MMLLTSGSWATATSAQTPGRFSLDVSIGPGLGDTGGAYRDYGSGLTGDIVAALRVTPFASGGLVAALGAGVHGPGAVTSVCIPIAPGVCTPSFPEFGVFSASVGLETAGGRFRGLVGPAAVHAGATAPGVVGRIDLSTPLLWRVWLLASAGGVLVPDYRGDSFRLGNVGVGFRIR